MSMHIALICSGRKRSPTILAASSTRLSAARSVSRREIRSAWIVSGTRTSTAPVAACQRSPTRTMRLSSISIRRNSSQKSGLPSERSRMLPCKTLGMSSISSSPESSVDVSGRVSGLSVISEALTKPAPHFGCCSRNSGRAMQIQNTGANLARRVTWLISSTIAGSAH